MPLIGLMVVIPQLRCKLHSYIRSSWLHGIKKKNKKRLLNRERNVNYESTAPLSCNFLSPLLSWRFFAHRDETNGRK